MLKYKSFIEIIGELAVIGGRKWYTNAFYASLLLYHDPAVARFYLAHLKRYAPQVSGSKPIWNADSTPMAIYCLRILDQRFGTTYWHPFEEVNVPLKHAKLIDQLLWMSANLRCDFDFETAYDLQRLITQLLHDTITIAQYQRGLLNHPPVRRMCITFEERRQLLRQVREVYVNAEPAGLQAVGNLIAMVDDKTFGAHYAEVSATKDRRLSRVAFEFLSGDIDQLERLKFAATDLTNLVDISRTLEIDAVHH